MTDAVQTQLDKLFNQTGGVTEGVSKADLVVKFQQIIAQAAGTSAGNYLQFSGEKDFILASNFYDDQGIDKGYVANGGNGVDTLVIDNLRLKEVSNIDIKETTFKDHKGQTVKGYEAIIRQFDANGTEVSPRTFRMIDIENIAFVDLNGNVNKINIVEYLESKKSPESVYVPNAGLSIKNDKASDKDDVIEVSGKRARINMLAGNDTLRVNELGGNNYVDQINGGGGVDTIELTNLTEADIKSITYEKRADSYTLTDNNGKKVIFKNFEKIKIGGNEYKILDRSDIKYEGDLYIDDIFSQGSITIGRENIPLLLSGIKLGKSDDKINIRNAVLEYATQTDISKPLIIDGGGGTNALDLSLNSADIIVNNAQKNSDGTFTLNVTTKNKTIQVQVKNINSIKCNIISNASGTPTNTIVTSTLTADGSGYSDIPAATPTTVVTPPMTGAPKPADPLDQTGFSWNNEDIVTKVSFGPDENQSGTVLKVAGQASDYEFVEQYDTIDRKSYTFMRLRSKGAGASAIRLLNIDGINFSGSGITYRLSSPSMTSDLTDTSLPVISVANSLGLDPSYSKGSDYFYGTDKIDSIKADDGNDTIYMSAGNDYVDGGAGTDTFVTSGKKEDYTIFRTQNASGSYTYYIENKESKSYTQLNNIENIVFSDSGTLSEPVTLESVGAKLAKNAESWNKIIYTWDGTSSITDTVAGEARSEMIVLPEDFFPRNNNMSFDSDGVKYSINYNGNTLTTQGAPLASIAGKIYTMTDLTRVSNGDADFASIEPISINKSANQNRVRGDALSEVNTYFSHLPIPEGEVTKIIGSKGKKNILELDPDLYLKNGKSFTDYKFHNKGDGTFDVYFGTTFLNLNVTNITGISVGAAIIAITPEQFVNNVPGTTPTTPTTPPPSTINNIEWDGNSTISVGSAGATDIVKVPNTVTIDDITLDRQGEGKGGLNIKSGNNTLYLKDCEFINIDGKNYSTSDLFILSISNAQSASLNKNIKPPQQPFPIYKITDLSSFTINSTLTVTPSGNNFRVLADEDANTRLAYFSALNIKDLTSPCIYVGRKDEPGTLDENKKRDVVELSSSLGEPAGDDFQKYTFEVVGEYTYVYYDDKKLNIALYNIEYASIGGKKIRIPSYTPPGEKLAGSVSNEPISKIIQKK